MFGWILNKRVLSGALLAAMIVLPGSLFADESNDTLTDTGHMRALLQAINAKDWEGAKTAAKQANDPVIYEFYEWNALRAGIGDIAEYEAFMEENAEWPGLGWLQAHGELNMPSGLKAARVTKFMDHYGIQTDEGLVRYLQALKSTGHETQAAEVLAKSAMELEISNKNFERIRNLNVNGFSNSVYLQADFLIWEGEVAKAEALLVQFTPVHADRIEQRLSIRRGEPSDAELGGAAFDRFKIALQNKNYEEADTIILKASSARENLGRPEYWASDRADRARRALWNGDAQKAYDLAAFHFMEPGDKGFLDLEFLAGFVALEFLFHREAAREHFQNLKDAASTPISNGRAGYWLGRAGDPTGYGYGAKWQTSFYGQLSAEKLGGLYDEEILAGHVRDYGSRDLLELDNIRVALHLHNAGNDVLARRFFAHQAETLPADDAESLGQLAMDLEMTDTALHIGKNLAARGEVIASSYYPVPEYRSPKTEVPLALVLGVTRQESEFYPRAQSHVGASGLMQLMPATAEEMAKRMEFEYDQDGLLDRPEYNIALGSAYLHEVLIMFDGRLPLAVLSYNAGPGRGVSWREHLGALGDTSDEVVRWLEQIPFDETRNYVQRVLESTFVYSAKLSGGFEGISPSALLLNSYPEGVNYAAIRAERARVEAERKRLEEEARENGEYEDEAAEDG